MKVMNFTEMCGNMSDEGARALRRVMTEEVFKANNIAMPKITRSEDRGRVYYTCNVPARLSKTGKRKTFKAKTPEEVQEKVSEFLLSDEAQQPVMTVQDAVKEKIDAARDGVKVQTYERYVRFLRNHISGTKFGEMNLADIRVGECESFIQSLYHKNLGYGSVKQIKSLISLTFDYAVSHDKMKVNYMQSVSVNAGLCVGIRKRENGAWTDEEVAQMWDASLDLWQNHHTSRYSAVIMLAIYTGARIGELLGLTWDDVDLQAGTMSIDKTAIRYTDYETGKKIMATNNTKTVSSRRVIELNDAALFWLNEIKTRNQQEGLTGNLVVQSKSGKMAKLDVINAALKYFCEKAGVTVYSSHAARKTFATMMIDGGLPLSVVSKILGHSEISTTQNVYYKPRTNASETINQENSIIVETVRNRLKQAANA